MKHFEERHAEFQPLFSRSEDTLRAPFVDFFCLQKTHRVKRNRSLEKDFEIRS